MSEVRIKQTITGQQCSECKKSFSLGQNLEKCPSCDLILTPVFADPLIGMVIDEKYKILDLIGRGATSRVYEALHAQMNSHVALKVLKTNQSITHQQLTRFQKEAVVVHSLTHPNITRVYDYGVSPEPYIVMEMVAGRTLAGLIAEFGGIPHQKALPMFIALCEGFEAAHNVGLIHRDIKPSNVLIAQPSGIPKILDFGLVKNFINDVQLTRTGEMVGTPAYMSPEQCRGGTLDQRSDIYSLGCLMFETLTGSCPFSGNSTVEVMFKQLESEVPSLGKYGKNDYPAGLQAVLAKALAKNAADRYATMQEMKKDLQLVQAGKGRGVARPKNSSHKKTRIVMASVAGAVLAGLGSVAAMLVVYVMTRPPAIAASPPMIAPTLAAGHRKYMDTFTLKPDQRYTKALHDVAVLTNQPEANVTTSLGQDGWLVTVGKTNIGSLNRTPSHADLEELLNSYAKTCLAGAHISRGPSPVPVTTITISSLMNRLLTLNKTVEKNGLDGATAAEAANCLAWLSVTGYDSIGGLDDVQAQALALNAIAKNANQKTTETDVLLDWDLGYDVAEKKDATSLGSNDPLRAYVDKDSAQLAALAEKAPAQSPARYLNMVSQQALGEESELLGALPGRVWDQPGIEKDLALSKVDMRSKNYFWHRILACEMLLGAVNGAVDTMARTGTNGGASNYDSEMKHILAEMDTKDEAGDRAAWYYITEKRTAKQINNFENTLPKALARINGKVFSQALAKQYYESFFYSALFDIADRIEYAYSSREGLQTFANSMGTPAPGKAKEMQDLVAARAKATRTPEFERQLEQSSITGAPVLFDIFHHLSYADAEASHRKHAGLVLAGKIDNRPDTLSKLASIGWAKLRDAWVTEESYRQFEEQTANPSAIAFFAHRSGNDDAVIAVIKDSKVSADDRMTAFDAIKKSAAISLDTKRGLLKLIANDSGDIDAAIKYCDFLDKHDDAKSSVQAMQLWMKQHPKAPGLQPVAAQTALARYMHKTGDTKAALENAKEAATSFQSTALETYAKLLSDSGDLKGAAEQYRKAYDRYQSDESFAGLLGTAWRAGKPEEAARLVRDDHGPNYSGSDYISQIGSEFIAAYKGKPEEAKKAFITLTSPHYTGWSFAEGIPLAYAATGDFKSAFDLMSTMEAQNGVYDGRYRVLEYSYLKKLKGVEAATQWLKQQVAASPTLTENPSHLAIPANVYGVNEILWSVIPLNPPAKAAAKIWNQRAQAELFHPGLSGQHKAELEAAVTANPDCTAGKYFLNKLSDTQLESIDVSKNPSLAQELGYARAASAMAKGDFTTAAQFYSTGVNMGPQNGDPGFRDEYLNQQRIFFFGYLNSGRTLGRMKLSDLHQLEAN